MENIINRFKRFIKDKVGYSLGIVIFAAVLVELISMLQYSKLRNLLQSELERRSKVELKIKSETVSHTLESAEATLSEHLWDLRRCLAEPDSMFSATARLIASNRQLVGGCVAFIPDYYPEKGRLFEPYASRNGDRIEVSQIGSPDHDYSRNPDFIKAMLEKKGFWGDPYQYVGDSVSNLTTYSYPLTDQDGEIVAICGLDIDLSWLSDTLNSTHILPSSFGMMFTSDGSLVAGPSAGHSDIKVVEQVVKLVNDTTVARRHGLFSTIIRFRDCVDGKKAVINYTSLDKVPNWQIAQISYDREIFSPLRKIRLFNLFLILAALLALFYMINSFAKNEKKLREANVEQARIGSELLIARNIQNEMLPKTFPDRDDIEIFGFLEPAKEVGGDLYDYFIRDGKLFFCIGDVSGKGVPAAMVMAVMQSSFRLVSSHVDRPADIVKTLNEEGCRNNQSNMFVTFFVGVLDLVTGRLEYCNAGHDKPMVIAASAEELPAKSNLPVGVFENIEFEEQGTVLAPGTTLFLYTDGLTEAKDVGKKQFTRKRVKELLDRCMAGNVVDPGKVIAAVSEDVHCFMEGADQADDLTMLAIRYSPDGKGLKESLTLQNDLNQVGTLGNFVKSVAGKLGLGNRDTFNIRLAVEEIVVNVMNYAYPEGKRGDVIIDASSDGKDLAFSVSDGGRAFDPTLSAAPDTDMTAEDRPLGGLGIHLAHKLMDRISYERSGDRNILTLIKSIK